MTLCTLPSLLSLLILLISCLAPTPTLCLMNEFNVWLCGYSYGGTEVYPHPVDCYRYIQCKDGYPSATQCPLGMYYVTSEKRCDWPTRSTIQRCDGSVEAYSNRVCNQNFYLTIPLPDTCALYLSCAHPNGNPLFYDRLLECPYPDLYDAGRRQCMPYSMVTCDQRPVPIAPCDYLQYQQTCKSPTQGGCTPCHKRHPSCRFHLDGPHSVDGHPKLFKLCSGQRTVDVRKCVSKMEFDPSSKLCVASSSKPSWLF